MQDVYLPESEIVYMDSTGHRMVFYVATGQNGEELDIQQQRCIETDFPGKSMNMRRFLRRNTVAGPVTWMGSLVLDNQDASGLMYRRNRYYDPHAGRFTQEDPIGLAGGVNAYGFAEGDPVSYGDPYGLSPDSIKFGGDTPEERQQARNLWNALASRVNEALTTEDASPSLRSAAMYLSTMMNRMWQDPYSYTIVVKNDYMFISNDGGGWEFAINGDARNRGIWIADEETNLNASAWILLAHELGGAYSGVRGGKHNRPAVRAENAARTLVGCHSRNANHDWDRFGFDWANPTCRR